MTMAPRPWAAQLLHCWFHELTPRDWYRGGSRVDAFIERRFAHHWNALRHRPADSFLGSPRVALAAILLFDQVPRNVFRDDPRAFATDGLAQAIAGHAIARGWDRSLGRDQRQFLYMPLMHSEDILDQRLSLAKFHELGTSQDYARSHHRMIARFGRFPHRNDVLGRRSTGAEERAVAAGFSW
jgi:uncharacterized protein (DUF924 family)